MSFRTNVRNLKISPSGENDKKLNQWPCKVCLVKATVWERMSVETISIIGMILSLSGVGFIVFSKRRKLIEGGRQSTTIEHPWIFAGGILLTILGVLAQVVVAYF